MVAYIHMTKTSSISGNPHKKELEFLVHLLENFLNAY